MIDIGCRWQSFCFARMASQQNLSAIMAFRTNLYEQENEKDSSRQHRHSFVNRLRTHTDGELSMNSTSFSHFNMLPNMDDSGRSSRRNNHRFGINQHHIAGEVMAGYTQPSNALPIPSMYSSDRNTSPLARSFRKLRSSTWDAGHGNLKLSPKMFGSSIAGNGLDRSNNLDQGKGRPAIDEDDSLDDEVVSFSSSSEESLEDAAAAATTIHIPMLDEEDELKEGLQSSLYQDEQDTTPLRSNTQLLIEANKNSTSHSNAENADHKRNNIPQRPSLRRDKSSSSADGVRRSVTFSTMVGLEQYADSEKLEDGNEMNTETTPDQVEQSPNSIDSAMYYHPETTHYEEQHRHQQRASNATKNDQFFDHFNPFSDLSWSLVGSYIVRYAPCFICMKKLGVSATDRNVLLRLNLLCAFHSVVQIALGIFLFVVTVLGVKQTNEYYANEANTQSLTTTGISKTVTLKKSDDSLTDVASADLWNLMLFVWILSVVSLVLLLASYFAQKAIRNVNLVRSVRFMWTLFWLLPIQIFLMIGLFDYYGVMDVYTKHWWDEPSMAWFRENLCKKDTSFTKCTVPIDGGEDYDSEEQWCEAYYDSLDCREIRDSAQTLFESFSYVFFTANGVWALLLVALMYVTLCVLQGIISLPIVQRSKESNIPLWLTFPIAGCFLIGSILLYGPR